MTRIGTVIDERGVVQTAGTSGCKIDGNLTVTGQIVSVEYADIATLSSANDTALNDGTVAWVTSLMNPFVLRKTESTVVDGITIVATNSGEGRWFRVELGSPAWSTRTAWYIDPSGGDDENDGLIATPLKTLTELSRRWRDAVIDQPTTVHILSDVPAADYAHFQFNINDNGRVLFKGAVTTVATGSFTAVTDRDPASNQQNEVTDTNLADTWDNLGYLNTQLRTTSGVNVGACAWIDEDLTLKAARVSSWIEDTTVDIESSEWDGKPGNVDADVGDEYVIESLPYIHDIDMNVHVAGQWGAGGWASTKLFFEDLAINNQANSDRYVRLRISGDFYAMAFNRCDVGRVQGSQGSSLRYCNCQILQPFFGYQIVADIIGGLTTSYMAAYATAMIILRRSVLVRGGIFISGGYVDLYGAGVGVYGSTFAGAVEIEGGGIFNYAGTPNGVLYGDAGAKYGVVVQAGSKLIYRNGDLPTISGSAGHALIGGVRKDWTDVPFFNTGSAAMIVGSD